jgi:hypothetical protein
MVGACGTRPSPAEWNAGMQRAQHNDDCLEELKAINADMNGVVRRAHVAEAVSIAQHNDAIDKKNATMIEKETAANKALFDDWKRRCG